VPLLTDPEAHGIAGPAFDVVIPSLPGYGFSDRSPTAGATPRATAERFVELMRGLGYERFVAHGSDFGAEVLTQLALGSRSTSPACTSRRSTGARISAPGPGRSHRPSARTSPPARAGSKASTPTTSCSRPSRRASATR
jgi:pimeloyl-ACP methyl ester carboxylesterase